MTDDHVFKITLRTICLRRLQRPTLSGYSTSSQPELTKSNNTEKQGENGRFNPLHIQLLPENLHKQIFKHRHNAKKVG